MSLTKLFNGKYAFQNIKKSKGTLAIMLIIIPIITLFFLYNYDSTASYGNSPYNITVLIGANLIGMFIIPIVVSNVLLGYVYQKNSIDFVNSMPISRKKIYLTNILVGILYLVALQFINFLIASIYVLIVKETSFSIALIADAFLIMSVGYTFLFVISSLALTVSGNKFTQIIVVAIILFLIPFIRLVNFGDFNPREISLVNYVGEKQIYSASKNPIYCVPIYTLIQLVEGKNIYNLSSILTTVMLSIVYIFIGTKLFEKRKMENTESSFKSDKTHLIIKAITLYPMATILNGVYGNISFPELVLLIFIILVYYFVYDLITNKKIKLKTTLISFILSLAILIAVNTGLNSIYSHLPKNNEVYIKDINHVELELSEIFYDYSISNYEISFAKLDNKEIIDFIFDNMKPMDYDYKEYYDYNDYPKRIGLKLKTNTGKEFKFETRLNQEVYVELLNKILNDTEYIKKLSERYNIKNDSIIMYDSIGGRNRYLVKKEDNLVKFINDNNEGYIKTRIQADIELYKNAQNDTYTDQEIHEELYIYSYENHTRKAFVMSFEYMPDDLKKEFAREINTYCKHNIKKIEEKPENYNTSPYFNFSNVTKDKKIIYYGNVSNTAFDKIIKLIKEDEINNFDPTKDYYIIKGEFNGITYFTNDIEKVEDIMQNEYLTTDNEIYYDNTEAVVESNEDNYYENIIEENDNF